MSTTPSNSTLEAPAPLLDELPSRISTPDTTLSSEAALKKKAQKEAKAAEAAAKKAQRKKDKEAAAAAGGGAEKKQEQPLRFTPREWGQVGAEKLEVQGKEVSIMTWNVSERLSNVEEEVQELLRSLEVVRCRGRGADHPPSPQMLAQALVRREVSSTMNARRTLTFR